MTEENLQARLRGVTLMALSNKWCALVLTTGNKSELAVGYCTLYGDMCGGLAVISDVPKTLVYELSRVANRRHTGRHSGKRLRPSRLRPSCGRTRRTRDSLPAVRRARPASSAATWRSTGRRSRSPQELNLPLALGCATSINKVDRNEYKRQQAAPGLKVTSKAFGIGRRFPIAQRYFE